MDIIFATKNKGKLGEIKDFFKNTKFNILGMEEVGFDQDIIENGATFLENALIKSRTIMNITNKIVISDDSGIEIDYLDKRPGVHSARFLGENTPYGIKNKKVLQMLSDVPIEKRTSRFVCVMVACFPDGKILDTQGTIEGYINYEPLGSNGFGYDPIFYVPEYKMTMAEMDLGLKNKISHRAKALIEMKKLLDFLAL